MPTMKGKDLQKWREKRNLTRDQLAKELKTTYTTVYRWETGERAIPDYLELALEGLDARLSKSKK